MNMPSSSLRERLGNGAPRPAAQRGAIDNRAYHQLKSRIHEALLDRIDLESMQRLTQDQIRQELRLLVDRLLEEEMVVIND
ncbi:MAG TPA: CpaF family protein, partial [Pseudoduganella sp.]